MSLQPRTVIVVNKLSGSFKLPAGVRIALRNCEGATCTSNEGGNELSFFGGGGNSVKNFQRGVLRFELQGSISEVTATGSTVTVSDTTVEKLNLTDCQTTVIKCTIQQGNLSGGETQSFRNIYQKLNLDTASYLYSQEDSVQKLTVDSARANFSKTTSSGTVSFTKGSVIIQDCEWSGDVTFDKSNGVFKKLTAQSVTLTGDSDQASTLTAQDCTFKKDLTVKQSTANLQDCSVKGDCDFDESQISAIGLTTQKLTSQKTVLLMDGGTVKGQAQLTGGSSRLSGVEFKDQFTGSGGAIQSDGCTFDAQYQFSGGTLDSEKDKMKDQFSASGLIGPCVIRNIQLKDQATISGDGASSLVLEHAQGSQTQLTVSTFSRVDIRKSPMDKLTVSQISSLLVDESAGKTGTVSDVGLAQFIQSDFSDGLTANAVDLLITRDQSKMTITNCTVNDHNSKIESASSCQGFTNGTTVKGGSGNNFINKGGDLTLTGSVVVTVGGTVSNTTGGLTMGNGFDPGGSSGVVCQQAEDLTIQAKGHVNITAGA